MSIDCLRDRVSPVPNSMRGRGFAGAPALVRRDQDAVAFAGTSSDSHQCVHRISMKPGTAPRELKSVLPKPTVARENAHDASAKLVEKTQKKFLRVPLVKVLSRYGIYRMEFPVRYSRFREAG